MTEQPTLTDGEVTLRPWRDTDVEAAVSGHDEVIAQWVGDSASPSHDRHRAAVAGWRSGSADGSVLNFVIERDGQVVGNCEVRRESDTTGELSWTLYAGHRGRGSAARAVRMLADWALTATGQGGLGVGRVQASVEPANEAALRVATRSGLRREGVRRVVPGTGARAEATEYVVLARLATDPPLSNPEAFRTLLNSFLPRKRAISQMLVRDPAGRVLLCQLTYKPDWDLPGGVVEVGESPRDAVSREVEEELGLTISAGALVLTDWLPAWSGWDDAVCLVFDGGILDPAELERIVRQEREIRSAEFCDPAQVRSRATDFTARRIEAALSNVDGASGNYAESGRPS
ncbi:NUDIX hydrolase [Nocardioides sp.]|uniref:NUDIX hydrolase n=1 Tax=Nocardioides sp. TaxID=35761 RepID=UPI003D0CC787